jgi:hypothetical protein
MKMFIAGCVVALAATIAVELASSATSTRAVSLPKRVKALEAKVKRLNGSVAGLQTRVSLLETSAGCLSAQGITQYGNPPAGQGYVYTNDAGATFFFTTGFDAPAAGATPSFYAARIDPSCITTRAFKLAHGVGPHRVAAVTARP